jgi:hypothetical protein
MHDIICGRLMPPTVLRVNTLCCASSQQKQSADSVPCTRNNSNLYQIGQDTPFLLATWQSTITTTNEVSLSRAFANPAALYHGPARTSPARHAKMSTRTTFNT